MKKGFTLIELLIVIALIAILASSIIIGLNPARQFAMARNAQRWTHTNSYIRMIQQNIADNNGNWTCATGALPETATNIASTNGYDICDCLLPTYSNALAPDPSASGAFYTDCENYDTGYSISQSAADGRITVTAPSAELGQTIGVTQ
ncbi:MAG: hypothetical protein UT32_C0024G0011 [Parcubacteria group bacterium GW2011_GWC2_39_14]|nr:MAG: hypothetical protein UT32_C0024G0011 [Parcubacteria group bacterium GW2011_GWC2_39_14]